MRPRSELGAWDPSTIHQGTYLEMQSTETKALTRRPLAPYQTTQNVESLEAYTQSLKHLEGRRKDLDEVLQRGLITAIKMAPFDVLKILEDFRMIF